MKKKMMSVLLVAAMLLSLLPVLGVGATDTVEYVAIPDGQGWSIVYETNTATETRVANLAKGEASDGTYSLHLTNDLGSSGGAIHVKSTSFESSDVTAGGDVKYELTLDVKNLWATLSDGSNVVKNSDGLVAMIGWGFPDAENDGMYDGDSPTADYTDGGVVKMKDGSSRTSLEALDDGWQRITYILDGGTAIAKGVQGFRIRVNSEISGDIYIDNISLKKMENGSAVGDNLIQNGTFEDGLIIYETEALDTELWTVGDTTKLTVANGVAKTGERSLHIKTTDTTNVQLKSKILTQTLVTSSLENTTDATKPKVANISFWLKGEYTNTKTDGSDLTANIGWEWDASRLRFHTPTSGDNLRPMTKGETVDGWTQYTGSFDYSNYTFTDSIPAPRWQPFFFNIECVCDIFIDDIVITVEGETANLLSESGTFEIESAEPDPEPEPEPEPETESNVVMYTNLPSDSVWAPNYRNNAQSETRSVDIAIGEYYTGNSSLHITNDLTSELSLPNTSFASADIKEGVTYTLSFYIKNIDGISNNNALYAQIGWGGWVNTYGTDLGGVAKVKDGAAMMRDTNTDKEGWIRVYTTFDGSAAKTNPTGFRFNINEAVTDIYIDDVTLTASDDATNTNLLSESGFEIEAPEDGGFVDTIKIYNGETEITDLTEASGKTLTVKTKVASFDVEKLANAQLIVAVYDGYEMKIVNATEITGFTEDGEVVEFTATITMPTYTEVGDYKVKAFVWDSLTGGRALAGVKEI